MRVNFKIIEYLAWWREFQANLNFKAAAQATLILAYIENWKHKTEKEDWKNKYLGQKKRVFITLWTRRVVC